MRNFITNTAGVTFFQDENLSFVVRKDYIEYVFKLGKGLYGVINLIISAPQQVSLFCAWGNFFDRVNNHQDINKLFNMLKKPCPTLIDLYTGKTDFRQITMTDVKLGGISKTVDLEKPLAAAELIGLPAVLQAVEDSINFSCKLYNEIHDFCPFDGWKKGLREI